MTYRLAYRGTGAHLACLDGKTVTSFDGGDGAGAYRVRFRSRDAAARNTDEASGRACAGVPLLAPVGGDVAAALEPGPALRGAANAPGRLPVIGDVTVRAALHYRVTADGAPEPHGVVHLALVARADPARYPLTDLWVDPASFAITSAGATFADSYGGEPARIRAVATFAQAGGFRVTSAEHVEFAAAGARPVRAMLEAAASDFAFPPDDPVPSP